MYTINIHHNNDPGLCARRVWGYLARQVNIYEWEGEDALDSFLCDLNILKGIIQKNQRNGVETNMWWNCDPVSGYTTLYEYDGYSGCEVKYHIHIDKEYEKVTITEL